LAMGESRTALVFHEKLLMMFNKGEWIIFT
jgi:hypothetical protein